MPNMSYCSMRNTLQALRDVAENWGNVETKEEHNAMVQIFRLAQEITNEEEPEPWKEEDEEEEE